MRIVVDECTGSGVAQWLAQQGHDVFSIYEKSRGISDDAVLARAVAEHRILINNDKHFGEKIRREGREHCGVIFLRLRDERTVAKIAALSRFFIHHAGRMSAGELVVITEKRIRFSKKIETQNRG